MPPTNASDFVTAGERRLHVRRLSPELPGAPLVFLHEGLGSVELWRTFPTDLVAATQHPGFVYSRYGNGWSEPLGEPRPVDYMHTEALDVLPQVVAGALDRTPILVGHSDGASIAVIYAGSGHAVEGLVLIAPHVFVEPVGVGRIAAVRDEFATNDLGDRMAAYHHEPETTFYGWADVWLHPDFQSWNLEEYLPQIECPVLLIQGDADEYGTTAQLDAIEEGVAGPVRRLMVAGARHSPHLSDPETVVAAAARFVTTLGAG